MKFVKIDPISGAKVSSGTCPDNEVLPRHDHEGLLVFSIEGEAHEYQFDHATMSLVRGESPVVGLRKLLIAEQRAPTSEELAQITGPVPVLTPKPE